MQSCGKYAQTVSKEIKVKSKPSYSVVTPELLNDKKKRPFYVEYLKQKSCTTTYHIVVRISS